MSYIDSSSLLKTLWEEPESPAVREAIAGEQEVVISTLAELETEDSSGRNGSAASSQRLVTRLTERSWRLSAKHRLSNFAIFPGLFFVALLNSILPGNGIADLSTGSMWLLWTNWVSAVC